MAAEVEAAAVHLAATVAAVGVSLLLQDHLLHQIHLLVPQYLQHQDQRPFLADTVAVAVAEVVATLAHNHQELQCLRPRSSTVTNGDGTFFPCVSRIPSPSTHRLDIAQLLGAHTILSMGRMFTTGCP